MLDQYPVYAASVGYLPRGRWSGVVRKRARLANTGAGTGGELVCAVVLCRCVSLVRINHV